MRGPDFIIIGAMKCASSTLHEQLALLPGLFMSEPKEPCYFSDDDIYAKGAAWYSNLFEGAGPDDLCGESSTHYTKLPTYPRTVERLHRDLGEDIKLIYIMRHPVDRMISHYIHEWSQGITSDPLDEAISRLPILVDYGCYAMQLRPFFETFGPQNVLPVFFERLTAHPLEQMQRVCHFIGYGGQPRWADEAGRQNVSSQRERPSPLREALRRVPGMRPLVRLLVPESARERIRDRLWRMPDRPRLSDANRERVESRFDEDLVQLGGWLGAALDCRNFKTVVDRPEWQWQLDSCAVTS